MLAFMRAILSNRRGATAVEYGLIVALVVITMVVSLIQLANTTTGMWNNVNTKVTAASGG